MKYIESTQKQHGSNIYKISENTKRKMDQGKVTMITPFKIMLLCQRFYFIHMVHGEYLWCWMHLQNMFPGVIFCV